MKKSVLSGIMAAALLASVTVMAQDVHPKDKQEVKKEAQVPQKEAKKAAPKKKETTSQKEHAEKSKPAKKQK